MKDSRSFLTLGLLLAGIVAFGLVLTVVFGLLFSNAAGPLVASAPGGEQTILDTIFGEAGATETIPAFEVVKRLTIAVILASILAFRPRNNVPLFRKSLFVSQTQILLAVVAASLMMVVGDNAARAFAIFAAASLVRFRTNIRDPKEITVLLISLALGLAAGVGRWDLGIALCLFALALLWLLEYNEPDQAFRSMELSVKTHDPEGTQEILKKIFKRLDIESEVREIEPPDTKKKKIGSISYYLNLRLSLTTDKLSDRILAADPNNIEGIHWSKTKSTVDLYK